MKVVLFGSTGAVGQHLKRDFESQDISLVNIIRKPSKDTNTGVDTEEVVVDYNNIESLRIEADSLYIAIGTTMKKAGSREAFVAVDRDLVIRIAKWGFSQGIKSVHVISSIGADKNAKGVYLKTKSEMEEQISRIGFDEVHIYRPSVLVAEREGDSRFAEKLSVPFMKLLSHMGGKMKKYQPITVERVASFMVSRLLKGKDSIYIYESDQMQ
ncbi:NAD(P)H-binding protein [Halosquirtibacter xylanolyticus]|uniref:NAD(P)H-binding protein n=1 Tax=Halosquirtibacter xylanolyticus TaxID=3374599 RepID=UPI00374A4FE0|nr:NAD(P)H-binding protein [Prolixibacteraceae bacterium]